MQDQETRGSSVGEMHKRRELMEDGRRYIIYYTFGDDKTERSVADDRDDAGGQTEDV